MDKYNFKRIANRKLIFAIATSLLSLQGLAQTNIAVVPVKLNVLYIGVDNPVSVAASASADEKVSVSLTGCEGTVSKTAVGLYNVRVSSVTDDCRLNVYVDGKLAGTSGFRVRNLPRPNATVGGFVSGSNVAAAVLHQQPGLSVYVKDFPFDVKYEVLGFTVSMLDNKNTPVSVDCQGAHFSSKLKEDLAQYVKPGDVVTIKNIMVKDPGGKEIKVPAIVYNIE